MQLQDYNLYQLMRIKTKVGRYEGDKVHDIGNIRYVKICFNFYFLTEADKTEDKREKERISLFFLFRDYYTMYENSVKVWKNLEREEPGEREGIPRFGYLSKVG